MPQLTGKIQGWPSMSRWPTGRRSTWSRSSTGDHDRRAQCRSRGGGKEHFAGIIEYSVDPIVSSDVVGSTHSGVYDSLATMVIEGNMAKTIVWFDNGWGYTARLIEVLETTASQLPRR